jgi:hypothetical protein
MAALSSVVSDGGAFFFAKRAVVQATLSGTQIKTIVGSR